MKLIHCADLHLDAKMQTHLPPEKAKERRQEILNTFERMTDYAVREGVCAILIAGDLFDTGTISAATRNVVLSQIANHPGIRFYYLKGNHGRDNFLSGLERIPENLKLFTGRWTSYDEGRVKITGAELEEADRAALYPSLVLSPDAYNIVMLHGQEASSSGGDRAEIIDLRALKNRHIDYLALGHVHAPKLEKLDERGVYCYPGCLEGRGFDECGPHGFMLMEIPDAGEAKMTFVPFASRTLHEVETDVSGCMTSFEIARRIDEALEREAVPDSDMVRIVLTGRVDVSCEKNPAYLTVRLDRYYFVKIEDRTTLAVRFDDYAKDRSLKGEFFRTVMAETELDEDEKLRVLQYGFQALSGEEPS